MTITYPITLPGTPSQVTLRGRSVVALARDPFTLQQQVHEHQGTLWEAEIQYPPMARADGEALAAALLSLHGMKGTFYLSDPAFAQHGALGTFTGMPLVNGASQTGYSLITDGWTNGITLKAGNYIQLGSAATTRLYKIVKDVTVDGSGNATLDLWPRLRESPGNNDAITISGCKGTFRLASNDISWLERPTPLYGISFMAIEAI